MNTDNQTTAAQCASKKGRVPTIIGIVLLLAGIGCIAAKAFTPEYLDAEGFLHESFFLLPIGFGGILCGIVLLLIGLVIHVRSKRKTSLGE